MRCVPWCTPRRLARLTDRQIDDLVHFDVEAQEVRTPEPKADGQEEKRARTPLEEYRSLLAVGGMLGVPRGRLLGEWKRKRGAVPEGATGGEQTRRRRKR